MSGLEGAEALEWVNGELSFFRNSDYKWTRELTTSFEVYFDKEFREFLSNADWEEDEIKFIFLSCLDTLFRMIGDFHSFDYLGDDKWLIESCRVSTLPPSLIEETSLNKEKIEGLFAIATISWRIFMQNIAKHLTNYHQLKVNKEKLDVTKRLLEIQKEKLGSAVKIYQKALEDDQKENKKKIENMIKSYVETCEKFMTPKPTNGMLEKISGVEERFWVHQKTNELFLKLLMLDLMKTYNQAKLKAKGDFWWDAIDYVEKRFGFTKDGYDFKRAGFYENIDFKNYIAKSVGEKGMDKQVWRDNNPNYEQIKNVKEHYSVDERNCDKCYKQIKEGNRCETCIEIFGEKD